MTETVFPISPLAIAAESATGIDVRLAVKLTVEENDKTPLAVVEFNDHARILPIAQIALRDRAQFVWLNDEGTVFTARPIRPGDAVLGGVYGYDLPTQVLAAVAYGQVENEMKLQAVVDEDDQRVLTLLLATDAGLFARYDGLWHPLSDPEVFVGSYLMDVYEDAIQLYDAADTTGAQVAAAALPTSKNETDASVPLPPDAVIVSPDAVLASASQLVEINTLDQLDDAVEEAQASPSIRWYVEKRGRALGREDFPW